MREITLIVIVLAIAGASAHAQDLEPRAYANAPIGLNFLIAGYGYTGEEVLGKPISAENFRKLVQRGNERLADLIVQEAFLFLRTSGHEEVTAEVTGAFLKELGLDTFCQSALEHHGDKA